MACVALVHTASLKESQSIENHRTEIDNIRKCICGLVAYLLKTSDLVPLIKESWVRFPEVTIVGALGKPLNHSTLPLCKSQL